jgi:phosphoribosylanthranilate isomerase
MTYVKICGLTNLADAQAAVGAGADYVGFICYERSPRYVTRAALAQIVAFLPVTVLKVGVFVNADPLIMRGLLGEGLIDAAQLHGDEPPTLVDGLPLAYKALRPPDQAALDDGIARFASPARVAAAEAAHPKLPTLMVDAYHPEQHGGTGLRVEATLAAQAVRRVPRLMLAGGLTPETVGGVVRDLAPFAVDVSSGVETSPGIKDHAKIYAFIKAVRQTQPSGL